MMMKISRLFPAVAAGAVLLFTACTEAHTLAVDSLHTFVDDTEMKAEKYSEEEWDKVNAKFDELMERIDRHYDEMTPEEQRRAKKDAARYIGIQTRMGLQEASRQARQFLEQVPDLIEGFTEGFSGDSSSE